MNRHQPSPSEFNDRKFSLFLPYIFQVCFFSLFFLPSVPAAESDNKVADIVIADFSNASLRGWQEKSFVSQTHYELVQEDERKILRATANASASGLFKEIRVDLRTHPYLSWQWRVERGHLPLAEREKKGDDYAARIYIVVEGGLFFWKTRAVNYVWSSSQPVGSIWANAFAGENVILVAQRGPGDEVGKWYSEKRNVQEDLRALFGEEINEIDAVAVMTDSDNSKGEVRALYGDIRFSAQ